ncbi:hypothetical protein C8F04DRAFT_1286936 [Mycena alexandri]|uniref:Uncharacterized protein n=1 Tax=Mycena alexandri TaxID=1745969 RepID=A0AAD6TCT3_9AGAR|nr:hypothetical protein C8F04DRAFT_1286936 [Mycena alexandri]
MTELSSKTLRCCSLTTNQPVFQTLEFGESILMSCRRNPSIEWLENLSFPAERAPDFHVDIWPPACGSHTWDHGWGQSNISLSSEGVAELCGLLIKTAARWRCVELESFDPWVHAPMLELLEISSNLPRMVGHTDAELLHTPKLALFTGEHLRELYLCSSNPTAFKSDVDWVQLTHLSISRSSALYTPDDEFIQPLELLQRTPRLVSFELGPNTMVERISEALTLAYLQKFAKLDPANLYALEDLFKNLWLPDLRYIALPPHVDAVNVLRCLSKKSPLVQHLFCSVHR